MVLRRVGHVMARAQTTCPGSARAAVRRRRRRPGTCRLWRCAATSRSPLTSTGTSSARTPHSSTVSTGSSPLEKLRPEHLLDALADDLLLLEPGEGEGVLAAAHDPALAVAHEEGGVGRRVVVVEQFEQERETALGAALGLAGEADVAVELARPVSAVGADERVGHRLSTQTTKGSAGRTPDRERCQIRLSGRSKERLARVLRARTRPRWAKAAAVAARPRGVRLIRPSCSR